MTSHDYASAEFAPKAFSQSLTVRINMLVMMIGVGVTQLLDVLNAILIVAGSQDFQLFLTALPPKARDFMNATLLVIGSVISAIGLVNTVVRVAKTDSAVAGPKMPGRGAGAVMLAIVMASVVGLSLAGCGAVNAIREFGFPKLEEIATPDQADEVLAEATMAYEIVVSTINALHKAELISGAKHAKLVSNDDSYAIRLRDGIQRGFDEVDKWRKSNDRSGFDGAYAPLAALYEELRRERGR